MSPVCFHREKRPGRVATPPPGAMLAHFAYFKGETLKGKRSVQG